MKGIGTEILSSRAHEFLPGEYLFPEVDRNST